ncbi:MAG: hypothetical protein ACOYLN_10450 [Blastocatellia bacterium]|jgi:hypothetical protein
MAQPGSAKVDWEWIIDAWKVFSSEWLTWILMQVVVVLFVLIGLLPIVFLLGGIGVLASRDAWAAITGLSVLAILIIPLLIGILICGGAFLIGGLYKSAIKKASGSSISISDLFSGGDSFLAVLGYLLLLVIVLGVVNGFTAIFSLASGPFSPLTSLTGTILNLIVFGLTFFALPLIVDRRYGVIGAVRESVSLTLPYLPSYIFLSFVVEILSGVGFILCFIGVVLTSHFQWTLPAVAYCDVFSLGGPGQNPVDDRFPAPPPPPDYRQSFQVPEQTIPAAEAPTRPLVCSNCGSDTSRMSNFCNYCGAPVTG